MSTEVCRDLLAFYPINSFIPGSPNKTGVFMFLIGLLYIFMSILTILFIKSQEIRARKVDDSRKLPTSTIFPVFVRVMWISVAISVLSGVVITFVPFHPAGGNTIRSAVVYAFVKACQHGITEGVALMLMQKGCGEYAARSALRQTGLWCVFVIVLRFFAFWKVEIISNAIELVLDALLFVFYSSLWLAPQRYIFRRPSAYLYARFWTYYRIAASIVVILFFFRTTEDVAACGYLIITLFIFAIFQPLVTYWALIRDSDWWQGFDINQGGRHESFEDIRMPLMGVDISLSSAQSLAAVIDNILSTRQVNLVNCALVKLDHNSTLGSGSFSKVYRGTYKRETCALKMIYTVDLTKDIIYRIAAEASILSAIQHPNVVHIYGVTVLPPSVCLILELCHFGSLSDVIRGPIALNHADRIYLALGCAKGVAAIHEYDASLCHRDIKSFNFLVDSQFNAKIADLELGGSSVEDEDKSHVIKSSASGIAVEAFLANWMAPELYQKEPYTQSSDVYSLGLVLWEIIAAELPFENFTQSEIREKLRSGFRHPIPLEYRGSNIAKLIVEAWSEAPEDRPSSSEIVSELQSILCNIGHLKVYDTDLDINLSNVIELYKKMKQGDTRHTVLEMDLVDRGSINIPEDDSIDDYERGSWWSRMSDSSKNSYSPLRDKSPISLHRQRYSSHSLSAAIEALNTSQLHPDWKVLEETNQPWAVFTAEPPHILVYYSSAWKEMFTLKITSIGNIIYSLADFTMDSKLYDTYFNSQSKKGLNSLTRIMKSVDSKIRGDSVSVDTQNKLNRNSFTDGFMNSFSHTQSIVYEEKSYYLSNRITEIYRDSSGKFIQSLSEPFSHGVLPMVRSLGGISASFLCSLHSYGVYPRNKPTIKGKHLKPIYLAILFNEFED